MSAFSDPQSVFRRMGHTPCSLTARKYKAAGTTGLLFDFTTVSHKTFLENPSTAREWEIQKVSSYHNHRSVIHHFGPCVI